MTVDALWRKVAGAERRKDYGAALYICASIAEHGSELDRKRVAETVPLLRFKKACVILSDRKQDVGQDTNLAEAVSVLEDALATYKDNPSPLGRHITAISCLKLAGLYGIFLVLRRDPDKERHYWRIAAELGESKRGPARPSRVDRERESETAEAIAYCCCMLGMHYQFGYDLPQDDRQAVMLYERAVSLGDAHAMEMLAKCYVEARGVERDLHQAFSLRRRAVRDYKSWSEAELARMYETGQGVARSYRLAYKWYLKSPLERDKQRALVIKPLARKEANNRLSIFGAINLLVLILPLVLFGSPKIIWWAAPVMAALALSLAFVAAPQIGAASRVRVSQKFATAQKSGTPLRIGGQKWVHSEGAFFHVVVSGGPRGTLYRAETNRNSRFSAELQARQLRRFLVIGLAAALAACGFVHAVISSVVADRSIADFLGGLLGVAAFCGTLFVVGWEILYQRGNQLISGAMVLDPDPMEGQREQVESQKALGDAEFNSERDAVAAASGARRLAIHDQEF